MKDPISELDRTAITSVIKQMENGWNAGDARAFAAPMSEDIDFITIRADHLQGRQAVVDSHLDVLATFYAGSTNHFNVETLRMLREDVALAHVRAVLESPSGPLKGRHEATYSLVLMRENGKWEATSFHITLATPTPDH